MSLISNKYNILFREWKINQENLPKKGYKYFQISEAKTQKQK